MREIAQRCLADGEPVSFPLRLLPRSLDEPPAYCAPSNYAQLFPENPLFGEHDLRRLQAEVADLRGALATKAVELDASHLLAHNMLADQNHIQEELIHLRANNQAMLDANRTLQAFHDSWSRSLAYRLIRETKRPVKQLWRQAFHLLH
jgi:hypothetical protein